MANITLRQSTGNTEPRLSDVTVKSLPLTNVELDNNFNNLNNDVNSRLKKSEGGTITGSVDVTGNISAGGTGAIANVSSTTIESNNFKLKSSNFEGLHRSPNAVTAMFLYDTSKDSDGGAWTEKCQGTSWYNETIYGKWLGAWDSETNARALGSSTYGTELLTNGDFSNGTTGWSTANSTLAVTNGILTITAGNGGYGGARQPITTVSGKTYRVLFEQKQKDAVTLQVGTSLNGNQLVNKTFELTGYIEYSFVAQGSTTYIKFQTIGVTGSVSVIDNISVREVTAQNTASGDYFQLTTDGKFYALNKNLLTSTATLATQTQWLTAGTYTLSSTTASSGSVAVSGAATASHTAGTPTTFTVATSGNVTFTVTGSVTTAQCELGSAATTYQANASTTRTTEVFRGNKRSFPKLAAIVAEAQSVTIYDLTEAGRPMWMRFLNRVAGVLGTASGYNIVALSAVNAEIVNGNAGTGAARLNFVKDNSTIYDASNNSGAVSVGIAQRDLANVPRIIDASKALVNRTVNAVAMTILPDAPVDPFTGLKVPTIVVATAGGISVIRKDGVVVNSTLTLQFKALTIKKYVVYTSGAYAATRYPYTFSLLNIQPSFAIAQAYFYTPNAYDEIIPKAMPVAVVAQHGLNMVGMTAYNPSNLYRSIYNTISNTFNTGHLVGDARRCFLADIGAGSVTGTELVTNGTFDTDTSGWTAARSVVLTVDAGKLRTTNGGGIGSGLSTQSINTVPGKSYKYALSYTKGSINSYIRIGTISGGAEIVNGSQSASGDYVYYFTAIGNTTWVSVGNNGGVDGDYNFFDDISVREVIPDRSYKARGADIVGTLTKTAAAVNAQLSAYSGFSAANYAREPYSADLDFGTGEWTASAWVNLTNYPLGGNLVKWSNDFTKSEWGKLRTTIVGNSINQQTGQTSSGAIQQTCLVKTGPILISLEAKPNGKNFIAIGETLVSSGTQRSYFDLANGLIGTKHVAHTVTIELSTDGYYLCRLLVTAIEAGQAQTVLAYIADTDNSQTVVDSGGVLIRKFSVSRGSDPVSYIETTASPSVVMGCISHRGGSSGPFITQSIDSFGNLTATAFDGTTTRTVTTSAAYNTGTWNKARVNYTTDGTLVLLVNGVEVAATRGNPLLTLNNSSAVLTIGNSYALDAPFPGSLALLKFSATVPTTEQSVWMYEQEKQLFRDGAQCVLPDSGNILDLTYDDATDKWIAVSAANESEWSGLVRTSNTASPAGSFSRVTATSGIQLAARTTVNPGVDISVPVINIQDSLISSKNDKTNVPVILDYIGGFTANTTNANTYLTSVSGLSVPSQININGSVISGANVASGANVVSYSGTTVYMSKPATGNGSSVQISFTDFNLPVGYEAKTVMVSGAVKQEGSTKDWVRVYDGFKETIRFAVAPGYNTWIQIQANASQ